MVKKTNSKSKPKTIRRTSTMLNAVAEGKEFLASTEKKRTTRTKTIAQTINEGKAILAHKPKKSSKRDESRSESVQPKAQKKSKKQKKIAKNSSKTSKPAKKEKNTKSDTTGKESKKISTKIETKPAVPSMPAEIKKTVFKTKSKDHLPIPAFGFIDICFCIDATGSMSGELAQAQSTIHSIIKNIQNKVRTEGLTLRFAIVSYRDHPPQESSYVTKALDFTDGHEAGQYVNNLKAQGGGDAPEAVHDGLMHCCKNLNWVQLPGTPILRYIFHIADSNPHGKEFGNAYQTNEGCLCGMKIQQVYRQINRRQIHFRLIKARASFNNNLLQMQEHFKKHIGNFQSADLANAKEMDVKVSDMIIQEVMPENM